jgi:hypothetical protein
MARDGSSWIGGGLVSIVAVPLVATACLIVARTAGWSIGDLSGEPTMMLVLWGPLFAAIITTPVSFVLGALTAHRTRLLITSKSNRALLWQATAFMAVGGASCGWALSALDILGLHVGRVLIPVGTVAGVVAGILSAWIVITDEKNATQ